MQLPSLMMRLVHAMYIYDDSFRGFEQTSDKKDALIKKEYRVVGLKDFKDGLCSENKFREEIGLPKISDVSFDITDKSNLYSSRTVRLHLESRKAALDLECAPRRYSMGIG